MKRVVVLMPPPLWFTPVASTPVSKQSTQEPNPWCVHTSQPTISPDSHRRQSDNRQTARHRQLLGMRQQVQEVLQTIKIGLDTPLLLHCHNMARFNGGDWLTLRESALDAEGWPTAIFFVLALQAKLYTT